MNAAIPLQAYLFLAAIIFSIGLYGVLVRRNAIAVLMSVELMLNAVNINMAAFSRFITPNAITGQIFAIFVITVAAAEAVVGIALVISIYRARDTIFVDKINIMKW